MKAALSIGDVLIRGGDLLARHPEFKLVGRDQELAELSTILMKMKKRNLVVTGRGGVGMSAIVLGIQESKKDHRTPVDIVGKRFYWLDTDRLFESGVTQTINELFVRVRQVLSTSRDSILVLEDAADFLKAAHNNGCTNLINGLMGDLKAGKYQAIFETKDDNLGELLKCDGDIHEFCTVYEVKEPSPEKLRAILAESVRALERHHGVAVSKSALETAAMLTEKYRITELRAQPDAAFSLLDQSLTDFCRQAHTSPQHLEPLEASLRSIEQALAGSPARDLENRSREELTALRDETVARLSEGRSAWDAKQQQVRSLYKEMSDGEHEIRKLEDEIERTRELQLEKARAIESKSPESNGLGSIATAMASGQMDTPEIGELKSRIRKLQDYVETATREFRTKVAEIYAGLSIDQSHVLRSFSALSGIPVDQLTEDEREKLRHLEGSLSERVIGQEEPTREVARAVKRSRVGLQVPNRPAGTFMFLGPSGVGKTELAKALAASLGVPLLRFDMSEYMEKHAVAKLIGAPPGYEGYEHGGILTNLARRNPYSVILFDEIEKAHPDVFNLMLQLLDDARLTDSRGLTASFKDAIIMMTTNIGTQNFLDEALSFVEAKDLALAELRTQYRPEFLGRFGGNIYCFKRLDPSVLTMIATKEIARINALVADRSIRLNVGSESLGLMIEREYVPREGARSILGYIDRNITSAIADVMLGDAFATGVIDVSYDPSTRNVTLAARPGSAEPAAAMSA